MSPRKLVLAAAAVAVALPSSALAASVRSEQTPEQIRAYVTSGKYDAALAKGYAQARRGLDAELKKQPKKPTVVLDIDETALSNYACLDAVDFDLSGVAVCVLQSASKAIRPARDFVRYAQRKKVAVVFITGAPEAVCKGREANLRAQGFGGRFTVVCKPPTATEDSVVPYKSGARKALVKQGRTILVNVGDQRSDLDGGAARRTVKLPNPIYVTA